MANAGGIGFSIEINTRECKAMIDHMYYTMKPKQFEHAMYGIYKRTGQHVRAILKKDLPKQYRVKAKEVGVAVKNPQLRGAGCIIPVRDKRKNIGGSGFKAFGGAHGWESLRKRYKVRAHIRKGGTSVLPDQMPGPGYTGNKPFRNLSASGSFGSLTWTRKGDDRLPVLKVSGIGIPQMPMNRSKDDVQADIMANLAEQVEKRFMYMIKSGK